VLLFIVLQEKCKYSYNKCSTSLCFSILPTAKYSYTINPLVGFAFHTNYNYCCIAHFPVNTVAMEFFGTAPPHPLHLFYQLW